MRSLRAKRLMVAFLAFAVAGSSLPGDAQARRPKPSVKRTVRIKAKRLFNRAQIQYRLGRFAKARKLYTRAYEVLPLPGFLYNIAQCHRMEKSYERALFFYKSYLGAKSTARNRDVVLLLITRCEQSLVRLRRQADARRRASPTRRGAPARRIALTINPKPYLPPTTPPPTPITRRWWFWTSIAGGVAALVITGVLAGLLTRSPQFEQTDLGVLDRRAR